MKTDAWIERDTMYNSYNAFLQEPDNWIYEDAIESPVHNASGFDFQ
jgi:hypothetical protein